MESSTTGFEPVCNRLRHVSVGEDNLNIMDGLVPRYNIHANTKQQSIDFQKELEPNLRGFGNLWGFQ